MSSEQVTRRTGWVGWIYFAGVMMVISGILNTIYGLVAAFNPDWAVFTDTQLLLLNLEGWGWLHIILGIIILISGIGVFSGNVFARTVGVICASVVLIGNFVSLPAYPFWSIVLITINVFVIWALIVHGDELES